MLAKQNIFEMQGLDDIGKKMQFIADNYPYESEELLTKMGNQFRKAVKEKTPQSKTKGKRKLIKSYKITRPSGYGKDISIEFRSAAPHFHLLERSHKKVNGGSTKAVGMVENTVKEFQNEFPKGVERMVDKMVKGLLK